MTELMLTLAALSALIGGGLWVAGKIKSMTRGYLIRTRRY